MAARDGGGASDADPPPLHVHLRAHREALGLTQHAAAERVGVRFNTLSDWERGRSDAGLRGLARLAAAYGVEPSALLAPPPGTPSADGDARGEDARRAATLAAAMEPGVARDWLAVGERLAAREAPTSVNAKV